MQLNSVLLLIELQPLGKTYPETLPKGLGQSVYSPRRSSVCNGRKAVSDSEGLRVFTCAVLNIYFLQSSPMRQPTHTKLPYVYIYIYMYIYIYIYMYLYLYNYMYSYNYRRVWYIYIYIYMQKLISGCFGRKGSGISSWVAGRLWLGPHKMKNPRCGETETLDQIPWLLEAEHAGHGTIA